MTVIQMTIRRASVLVLAALLTLTTSARAELLYRWVPDFGSGGSGHIRLDEAFIEASDDGTDHYVYTDAGNFITEFGILPVIEFAFTFNSGLVIDSVVNFSSVSTIQTEHATTQFAAVDGVMDGWTFSYDHYDAAIFPHIYEQTTTAGILCIRLPGPQPGGDVLFSGLGGAEFHEGSFQLYVPGDGNGDGLDYLVRADKFGDDPAADPPGSPENGDFNDDGVVDGLDYLLWASNFEMGPNDGVAVPEPSSALLAVLGALAMISTIRRSRS
jgi:hypothetical protein